MKKKSLAESQGFKVIEVWNNEDFHFKHELIINEIKKDYEFLFLISIIFE